MRYRRFFMRLCLSLGAILLALLSLEIALRAFVPADALPPVPLHLVSDSPVLYGLNPDHPDISSQGLRDDEVAVPKPAGVRRILVLGDSVAYGSSVPRQDAFPNRLERMSREEFGAVEVINAAVMGYTPYNELQYYLHRGKDFGADIVLVAFCMNDVANPRLHWGDAPGVKFPSDAIPNADYDRDHILPRVRQLELEQEARRKSSAAGLKGLLSHSRLY
ncbi:MAG: SGNH/GDSL hydrolase family protein, partial [Acidobacteria bacterium]|nr:SGNH/GDSL hydrolase family protein [Acidobacteriota bacterium]